MSGIIKIKVKYLSESNTIKISVKDSGHGIKEDNHNLIFQENIRLNINQEHNKRGSGLGLSISKNLALSLNHEIGFKSVYGKGSKFFLKMECNQPILNKKEINLN